MEETKIMVNAVLLLRKNVKWKKKNIYHRIWKKNKDKIIARKKEYRRKNKEKIAKQKKEYRKKNFVKITKREKKYEADNKIKISIKAESSLL